MSDTAPEPTTTLPPAAEDAAWAKALSRKVGLSLSRAQAEAKIADGLARAIAAGQVWRVTYLLTTPLPSLFTRKPALPDVEKVFTSAFDNLGRDPATTARQKFPALYDAHRASPLLLAVLKDEGAVVDLLLQKGAAPFDSASPNPTGYDGPLGAAIFLGKYALVTKLMAQPSVQKELAEKPAFRNYLLLTALGTDCQATLDHLAKCDPELLEKGRVYGDRKAAEFTLGEGVLARKKRLRAEFDAQVKEAPPAKAKKPAPLYRSRQQPEF
jgi:hypothetical protein